MSEDERAELKEFRKAVRELRMEQTVLKKGQRALREENEVWAGDITYLLP